MRLKISQEGGAVTLKPPWLTSRSMAARTSWKSESSSDRLFTASSMQHSEPYWIMPLRYRLVDVTKWRRLRSMRLISVWETLSLCVPTKNTWVSVDLSEAMLARNWRRTSFTVKLDWYGSDFVPFGRTYSTVNCLLRSWSNRKTRKNTDEPETNTGRSSWNSIWPPVSVK